MSAVFGLGLTCEEVEDSLSAYALGALDPDEVDAVDAHLAGCDSCRNQLARELETVGALASMVEPVVPSPEARRRLLEDATALPPARTEPVSISEARSSRKLHWLLAATSVAAAILLIGVGVLGVLLSRAVDDRDESQNVAQLLSTYISSGGQVVTMEALPASIYENYEGQGSLLLAPGMEPAVVVAECPESGEHLTYRVWFSRNGDRTGVGTLTVGDDGSGWLKIDPTLELTQFDMIGITAIMEDEQREDVLMAPLANSTNEG
jgi:hypothetical protein